MEIIAIYFGLREMLSFPQKKQLMFFSQRAETAPPRGALGGMMATAATLLASVLVGQPNNVLLVYMDDLRTNVDGTEVSDPSVTLHLLPGASRSTIPVRPVVLFDCFRKYINGNGDVYS